MSRNRQAVLGELKWEARAAQAANDAFDEAVVELLGVNRTDARCIDILEREGRLTAGQLAKASGLTSGAVTAVLDRLERAGYARRIRDADDRRRVFVEPTEKTRIVAREFYGGLEAAGDRELRRFTVEELALIRDFLRLDRELKEREFARLKARRA
jgi:DNA-binding MarR family transcriptional regulator